MNQIQIPTVDRTDVHINRQEDYTDILTCPSQGQFSPTKNVRGQDKLAKKWISNQLDHFGEVIECQKRSCVLYRNCLTQLSWCGIIPVSAVSTSE